MFRVNETCDKCGVRGLAEGKDICPKCTDDTDEINAGHYHEIIDRCHVICSMIDDFLIDHPGMTKEMNTFCETAQQNLCAVSSFACAEDEERFGN